MKLYIEDGGELSLLGEIMSMNIPVSAGREVKGEVEFLVLPWNEEHRPKIGHMSKKRFVKLLMSIGYRRNVARALASAYSSGGYSYATAMCHVSRDIRTWDGKSRMIQNTYMPCDERNRILRMEDYQ